jgi:hypothetical protein
MVSVWDKDNKPSKWSKPAVWSMGLLEPNEFKAEWIGFDNYLGLSRTPEEIRIVKIDSCLISSKLESENTYLTE